MIWEKKIFERSVFLYHFLFLHIPNMPLISERNLTQTKEILPQDNASILENSGPRQYKPSQEASKENPLDLQEDQPTRPEELKLAIKKDMQKLPLKTALLQH